MENLNRPVTVVEMGKVNKNLPLKRLLETNGFRAWFQPTSKEQIIPITVTLLQAIEKTKGSLIYFIQLIQKPKIVQKEKLQPNLILKTKIKNLIQYWQIKYSNVSEEIHYDQVKFFLEIQQWFKSQEICT